MRDNNTGTTLSRRGVLRGASTAGALSWLGGSASGEVQAANGASVVQLGEFSTELDGWTTTGRTGLDRVDESEIPVAVEVGTHALAVGVDGDLHPVIENKERVKKADFEAHPHLLANVYAMAEETDSDLVFTFRLHHAAAAGAGDADKPNGNNAGGEDQLVVESDELTIPQLRSRTITWDMSDLDDEVLRTARRLEIIWYLADHPPDGAHRGQTNGGFDYRGLAVFDDIKLTDEVAGLEAQAGRERLLDLHSQHGMIVDRRLAERTATVREGTLVFGDGTEIPFRFEVVDERQFRYTLDGESFAISGGIDD